MEKKTEKLLGLANAMVDITTNHDSMVAYWLLTNIEQGYENNASWIVISQYEQAYFEELPDDDFAEKMVNICNSLKFTDAIKGYTLTYDERPSVMIRL